MTGGTRRISEPLVRQVAEYLRAAAESEGLTETQMGARLGISQQHWNLIRRDLRGMSLEVLCRAIVAFPGILQGTIIFMSSLVAQSYPGSSK